MQLELFTDEEWRPVVDFAGFYEVSCHGRVRSLDRPVPNSNGVGTRTVRGQLIRPQPNPRTGHLQVGLSRPGQKQATAKVHQLVAEAFIGPRPPQLDTCHNDGNPANNRVENLRYDTRSENLRDKARHGTDRNAAKTHCPSGHAYTPENTYRYERGRQCRACTITRATRRNREQRRRAA